MICDCLNTFILISLNDLIYEIQSLNKLSSKIYCNYETTTPFERVFVDSVVEPFVTLCPPLAR